MLLRLLRYVRLLRSIRRILINKPWYIEPEMVPVWEDFCKANRSGDGEKLLHAAKILAATCPAFLLHCYAKIQDKEANLIPFADWSPAQVRLYRVIRNLNRMGRPVRVIVLKARQMGISTLCEGMLFWLTAFKANVTSLIAAQEDDACGRIFEMFRVYYHSLPEPLRPDAEKFSMEEIRFGDRKSSGELGMASRILTKTVALGGAKKSESGRGRGATYHGFHGSEVAFWPNPERFMTALEPGIPKRPNTYAFLESTANGTGNFFHRRWIKASKGWRMVKGDDGKPKWMNESQNKSFWVPVFLSWLEHPEYRLPFPGGDDEKEREYYTKYLDREELALVENYGADLEQIEWRRFILSEEFDGDLDRFHQEYPATPEAAFVSSDRKVFDTRALSRYEANIMKIRREDYFRGYLEEGDSGFYLSEDRNGPLKVMEKPEQSKAYVIGADPCIGRGQKGDFACAQVVSIDDWKQVAVFNDRVDPDEFASVLEKLGRYYHNALLVVEVNGPGQLTDHMLSKMEYWNRYRRIDYDKINNTRITKWGWQTNVKSRSMMVGSLKASVREMRLDLFDSETLDEMNGWVRVPSARGQLKEQPNDPIEGHDDRIIALGLALQGGLLDNPIHDESMEARPEEPSFSGPGRIARQIAKKNGAGYHHPVLGKDF